MKIWETPIFFETIQELLPPLDHWELQDAVVANPEIGALIRGGEGLRKMRWALPGRGKSGGIRVIYKWNAARKTIFFVVAYAKSKRENLTPAQLKTLVEILKEGHDE